METHQLSRRSFPHYFMIFVAVTASILLNAALSSAQAKDVTISGRLASSLCKEQFNFFKSGNLEPPKKTVEGAAMMSRGGCHDYRRKKTYIKDRESPGTAPGSCRIKFMEQPCQQDRIIGGSITAPYQYPSFVHVHEAKASISSCGGVIIDKEFIVTAAHCLEHYRCVKYRILAGNWKTSEKDYHQIRKIKKVALQPKFHTGGPDRLWSKYDVAVAKLESPLELNDKVAVSALPSKLVNTGNFWLIGFGRTDDGKVAKAVHHLQMPALTDAACQKRVPHVPLHEDMICMYKEGGNQGVCYGDSGSPLFSVDEKSGQQQLVGITTFITTMNCKTPDAVSVFQELYYYVDWIQEFVKANPSPSPLN